jgi:hypothetical protein
MVLQQLDKIVTELFLRPRTASDARLRAVLTESGALQPAGDANQRKTPA